MDRVPNEVFRFIFLLSVLGDSRRDGGIGYNGLADEEISEGHTWPGVFKTSEGPWAISRVSRQWREISTTFPQLWSCFSLMPSDLDHSVDGTTLLTTWMSFAGTSNLSFLIEPDGICNNPSHPRLFELLMNQSNQWEKIEFFNSVPIFWSMLHAHNVRSHLDLLKKITVHSEEANIVNDALSGDPIHYEVFLHAPQLHSLINRNHLPTAGLQLPWSQLTEYEGSYRAPINDHFLIIRRTPNLEICRLNIAYVGPPTHTDHNQAITESSQANVIFLPNLHTLHMRTTWLSDSTRDLSAHISHLRVPTLQFLRIASEHLTRISTPLRAFANVLRSSSCELRSLELTSRGVIGIDNVRSEDVLDLLRATPALRDLCITVGTSGSSSALQNAIIHRLDPYGGNQDDVLVPVLEILEFRLPSPSAIPMVDLTALGLAIHSRWMVSSSESIRKLRFIIELGNGPLDEDMLSSAIRGPIMEALEEARVDIVIETRYVG